MGRKLTALVLVALIALAHPALVIAQGGCSVGPTWLTGDSFTASALNSLQTRLGSTNMISSCIDGQGDTNAMFDDTLAPTTSAGARALSTQLYHDIANLRYVALHVFGATNWWSVPYENVNFRHRQIRQHFGTLFDAQQALRVEGHLSSSSTRFHFVAIGTDREMAAGSAHPESAWFLIHVNSSVRFMVGLGGDVHVGNTLAVHAAGTATHAAIFRKNAPASGIFWPVANHLAIGSMDAASNDGAAEVARFHLGGIALARAHVNGTTPPRNTLTSSNIVKAWATISGDTTGATLLAGYGITSVTRSGAGVYVLTVQNPFTGATNLSATCTPNMLAAHFCTVSLGASALTVRSFDSAGVAADTTLSLSVIGLH